MIHDTPHHASAKIPTAAIAVTQIATRRLVVNSCTLLPRMVYYSTFWVNPLRLHDIRLKWSFYSAHQRWSYPPDRETRT